jgi:hypothetical protein
MNKKPFILSSLVAFSLLTSCSSPKSLSSVTKSEEVSIPFSDNKYKSDKDYFRTKQVGKSPDLATSKKIALQNVKAELAGNIKSVVKKVTEQYTNQRTVGNKQEFENKFEELSREVVDQSLTNIRQVDEKVFKEMDGSFTYWVVLEIPKQSVLDEVNSKISKNEKLQLDYDKQKFETVFNSEMEKFSKEQ